MRIQEPSFDRHRERLLPHPTRLTLAAFAGLSLALAFLLWLPLSHAAAAPALSAPPDQGTWPPARHVDQRGQVERAFAPAQIDAPAEVISGSWTNLYSRLSAVSAASTSEAWALGVGTGRLLHFSAGAWNVVTPTGLSGLTISDIQMSSATDGWLTAYSSTTASAFQYDGTNWNDRGTGLSTNLRAYRLAVLSDTNIWATGTSCTAYPNCTPTLLHWNGTAWSVGGPSFPGTTLTDIVMASPTDGWVTGYVYNTNPNTPVLYHYDGTTWTAASAPPGAGRLWRMAAPAVGEAWAVGEDSSYVAHLYHLLAGTWAETPTPDGSDPADVFALSPAQVWATTSNGVLTWTGTQWVVDYAGRNLTALSAVSGQVWAVGEAETILSKTGANAWVLQRGGPTTEWLEAVAVVNTDEAWAVGGRGTFIHYISGTWQLVPTVFTDTIWNIQMLSATDGYAVGNNLIAHWDGTTWTRVASPGTPTTTVGMYGIAMTGPGAGWAVGSGGRIWQATNGVWFEWRGPGPGGQTLFSVAMDSPTHGWAVGGLIGAWAWEYTGSTWVDRRSTLPVGTPGLHAVITGPGPDEARAGVWNNSTYTDPDVLHYSGGTWTWEPGLASMGIESMAAEALGEVWAVGYASYHYANGSWQSGGIPTSVYPLNGISLVPGRGGWVVGPNGMILHYNPLAPGQRFYDVPLNNTFASYIEWMANHGYISGYADNTFHPNSNVTRGQLLKMVVNAAGWTPVIPATPSFEDVPTSNTFYTFIETGVSHGVINGYPCGQNPFEPCVAPGNRPYFRPNNNLTRGQLSKVVALARGYPTPSPATATFEDVPPGSTFYVYVEAMVANSIVGGYPCGSSPSEPCVPPGNRPYFRTNNSATRGQVSKIVTIAYGGPAQTR
jgi:hypothetical protein